MSQSNTDGANHNLPLRKIFETMAVGMGTCSAFAAACSGSIKPALVMGMAFGVAYVLKR